MKNVILYARVSTSDQADNGYSLPHQKEVLERYCEIKGHNVLITFTEDYSAKTFERPQWKKLEKYISANRKDVDLILFTRWDRFSRNSEEAQRVIRVLRKKGIEVNSVEQPLDLDQADSKILLAVYLTIPEIENDKNSIRTMEGMRRANKEGYWTGKAPFGYDNVRLENLKPTLRPNDKASVVREAFELFSLGIYPMEVLRKKLMSKGMKLQKQAFNNMLRNVVYTGKIPIKEWKKEPSTVVIGLHEPIISDHLYNSVQKLLQGNKKKTQATTDTTDCPPEFILRKFIVCGNCGGHVTGGFTTKPKYGKVYPYFRCQKCGKTNFSGNDANRVFEKLMHSLQAPEEVLEVFYHIMDDKFRLDDSERIKAKVTLDAEIELNASRKNAAFDKYIDGLLSEEVFLEQKERYEKERNDLIYRRTELDIADKGFKNYLETSLSIIRNFGSYYSKSDIQSKQEIIRSIFAQKLVFDGKKYRTTETNEVIRLITNDYRTLELLEIKKADGHVGFSSLAPRPGLEPSRTSGND